MSGDRIPAIRVGGVWKHYQRGSSRVGVLRDANIEVGAGEFVALMGPSGSGKSTLLHLIAGLDRPDDGRIEVCRTVLDGLSERRLARWRAHHIGFVFQFYHLMPTLNAAGNVELPLLLSRLDRAERALHVATALALAGLSERAKHLPHELSGGEQQRVAVARAIAADAPVLLCDEPTGDLDRRNGDAVLDLLGALATDHGKTLLMVTHDPRAAARAKRILYLEDGAILDEAPR